MRVSYMKSEMGNKEFKRSSERCDNDRGGWREKGKHYRGVPRLFFLQAERPFLGEMVALPVSGSTVAHCQTWDDWEKADSNERRDEEAEGQGWKERKLASSFWDAANDHQH